MALFSPCCRLGGGVPLDWDALASLTLQPILSHPTRTSHPTTPQTNHRSCATCSGWSPRSASHPRRSASCTPCTRTRRAPPVPFVALCKAAPNAKQRLLLRTKLCCPRHSEELHRLSQVLTPAPCDISLMSAAAGDARAARPPGVPEEAGLLCRHVWVHAVGSCACCSLHNGIGQLVCTMRDASLACTIRVDALICC